MRARLLIIVLGLLGLFSAAIVFRVDQMLFSDKLNWGEAQARAQMGALTETLNAEIKSARQTLELAWPQVSAAKKDYGKGWPYSRFLMMGQLAKATTGEWTVEPKYFLVDSPAHSWAPSYATLALRKLNEGQIPVGGTAIFALLDPSRKTHLLLVTRTPTQWLAALTGPEFFQAAMDRQKGLVSTYSVVNSVGQTLGHTIPEYIGSLLTEDPVVADLMRNESGAGSGIFQTAQGQVQGFYEQVPQTNVYVVASTPMSELLGNRKDVRWQLVLMGLGFSFVGFALIMFMIRDREANPPPVARPAPAAAPTVSSAGASGGENERLQAYTRAASSLAHELRAPLLSLLGRSRLLRENISDAKIQKELMKIEEGAREAHGTLHKLLTFAGEKEEPAVPTSLSEVIQRTLFLVQDRLKERGIDVEIQIEEVPLIHGQPTLLVKAFEQILQNSIEAMDRVLTKKLTVSLKNTEQGPRIHVIDTGEGITAGNLNHIFDPFFTTRASQQHSGLGLSLALGIVRGCGGQIVVNSTPGQGTQVEVQFPPDRFSAIGPSGEGEKRAPEVLPDPLQQEAADLVKDTSTPPTAPPSGLPEVLNDQMLNKTLDMIDRLDDLPEPFAANDGPPAEPPPFHPPKAPPAPGAEAPEAGESAESSAVDGADSASLSHEDFMKFTAKIDKPNINLRKKAKRLLDVPAEIRKPGERS
jgi:signal transduction histidine kinase